MMDDVTKKKLATIKRIVTGLFLVHLAVCAVLFIVAFVTINIGWALITLLAAMLFSSVIMIPVLSFANLARFCVLKKSGFVAPFFRTDKILSIVSASFGLLTLFLYALTFAPFKLGVGFVFASLLVTFVAFSACFVIRKFFDR